MRRAYRMRLECEVGDQHHPRPLGSRHRDLLDTHRFHAHAPVIKYNAAKGGSLRPGSMYTGCPRRREPAIERAPAMLSDNVEAARGEAAGERSDVCALGTFRVSTTSPGSQRGAAVPGSRSAGLSGRGCAKLQRAATG